MGRPYRFADADWDAVPTEWWGADTNQWAVMYCPRVFVSRVGPQARSFGLVAPLAIALLRRLSKRGDDHHGDHGLGHCPGNRLHPI